MGQYDFQGPTSGKDDTGNKYVRLALTMMQKNFDAKIIRDNKNLLINRLIEEGFEVADPTGIRKIPSYMLQQAIWRCVNRTKPLDYEIHGQGRSENHERLVTEGVNQVMEMGGFVRAIRDKGGAFNAMYRYGDAFIRVGTDPDNDQDCPILFENTSNSNVYLDSYATRMRGGSYGQKVTQMCVVYSYSKDAFDEMYPQYKGKVSYGKIPRDLGLYKENERTYIQSFKLDDLIEVAHYYNTSRKCYATFAGTSCTLIGKPKEGEKYPFVKDGEPYIPVIHWYCMPSAEGFYNYGIGDILYKMALVQKRLMNMAIGHVEENTYPITMINVPQGEASKFFNKLAAAHEMRAVGKKGYVAMEYDPSNPNSGRVQSDTLLNQSLINEWEILFDKLDKEIRRMGINLDDTGYDANTTATQIMAEEENQNAFIKQVMEYNASEQQFAVELTMDFIKKFIEPSNTTPLRLTTKIELDGQKMEMDNLTLGDLSDELRKYDYFVKINSRTGAIPSNMMQQAQISRMLQVTPPGTPGYGKLMEQYAQINDRDITMADIMPQMPQQGALQGNVPEGTIPTGTDRTTINPHKAEQMPAF